MKIVYVIHLAPLNERQQQAGQAHTHKRTRSKLSVPPAALMVISSTIFVMSGQTVGVTYHVVKQVHESTGAPGLQSAPVTSSAVPATICAARS
jgi:predicted MFS family arabinose efflux permease